MPYKDPAVYKAKAKEYSAKHYQKTKEATKKRSSERRSSMRKDWKAYKSTLYCTKCGFNHIATLDFHHIDPATKTASVNDLVSNGKYALAMEEAKKCIILCANCHRIHHHDERQAAKKAKKKGAEAP
jgi:hypothetical protein